MTHKEEEVHLSKKSRTFLDNLRVYLFSSGKNDTEINEIVDELEVHLIEAEQNGKSVEHIIGQSPKVYMNQLSQEMPIDYKTWMKYIPLIIFGAFAFIIIGDLFEGTLSYSLLEIAGFLGITVLFLASVSIAFRYISGRNLSTVKQFVILYLIAIIQTGLFVGLIFLNQEISTPMIEFGVTGSTIIGILTGIFIIATSVWSKTWVIPIVLAFITLPDFLLEFSSMTESSRLITGSIITFGGIFIYIFFSSRTAKN